MDSRAVLYPIALGDRNGISTFYQSSTIYSSSLKKPNVERLNKEWPTIKLQKILEVKSMKLDTFCDAHNVDRIDFVWADVQGAEDLLIKGGTRSLTNRIKYFYTEYSNIQYYQNEPDFNKILQLLGSNWKIVKKYQSDVLLKNINIK